MQNQVHDYHWRIRMLRVGGQAPMYGFVFLFLRGITV